MSDLCSILKVRKFFLESVIISKMIHTTGITETDFSVN